MRTATVAAGGDRHEVAMQIVSGKEFSELGFQHGDVLLFDYCLRGGLQPVPRMIRSVQRRLLRDLGDAGYCDVRRCSHYSHAAIVGERGTMLEMTYPAARVRWTGLIPAGVRVMVRRPRHGGEDIAPGTGDAILEAAWRDVAAGRRYPFTELLTYWLWSWGFNKLLLGRKFAKVFRSSSDVCSGSVWRWCVEAGLYRDSTASDLRPEAWYPARLAADGDRFRTLGVWKIIA